MVCIFEYILFIRFNRVSSFLSQGPPAEQDIPLNVPKKTKLYVEQTQRERSAYANDSAVRALMEQTEAIALLRKQLIEGEERLTEERAAFAATVAGARRRRPANSRSCC